MKTGFVPLLVAIVAISSPAHADKPRTFCGKTLEGWIETLQSRSQADVRRAVVSLGYFGPEAKAAVPRLVELLQKNQFDQDVIETLGRIGPSSAPAVPLLIEKFRAETCFRCMGGTFGYSSYGYPADALRRIGRPVVGALIKVLNDPNPEIRPCAAEILGQLGPASKDAVPALVAILEQELTGAEGEDCFRSRVINALGRIGPDASSAIPTLDRLLDRAPDPIDPDFRHDVAEALARIGQPPIRKLLSLSHADACYELSRLGPLAKEAIPELRDDLADDCLLVRINAAAALAHIDPTILEAIPPLIEGLDSVDEDEWGLPELLSRYGPTAEAAIPSLIRRFEADPNDSDVLRSLTSIDPEGSACIPSLISGLKLGDAWAVNNAAECLGLIGPKAMDAIPALRAVVFRTFDEMGNENPPVAALKALARIDPGSRETLAILCQALKYKTEERGIRGIADNENEPLFDYSVATAAASLLGTYGPAAKSAVPALTEALQVSLDDHSKSCIFSCKVALALGRIGPDARSAIPVLRKASASFQATALQSRPNSFAYYRIDEAAEIALVSIDLETRKQADTLIANPLAPEIVAALLGVLGRPSLESEFILRYEIETIEERIRELNDRPELLVEIDWRIERLSRFGFGSRAAIPILKEWRKHSNPWLRLWFREAIERIP